METQIYSIQTSQEALDCIKAGADRIGLLVGPKDGPFPCAINEVRAKEVFESIGDNAVKILICTLEDEEEIIAQTERLQPDVLHLCAGYEGDSEFREQLKERLPGVE